MPQLTNITHEVKYVEVITEQACQLLILGRYLQDTLQRMERAEQLISQLGGIASFWGRHGEPEELAKTLRDALKAQDTLAKQAKEQDEQTKKEA